MTLRFQRFQLAQALTSVIPCRRFRRLATLAFWSVLCTFGVMGQSPVDSTLTRLLGTDPYTFALGLERHRPSAISQDLKARILNSLPVEGEVKKLKQPAQHKLNSLEQILRAHQRQSVYEIKVIAVPQAFIGLHGRAVILISNTALDLLDTEELQALVAHEIGHEYVWAQYETARDLNDRHRLQELEFYCDGVAILTLGHVGLDPSRLVTGLEKVGRFNRKRFGEALNEDYYPPFTERRKFAQAVTAWAAGSILAHCRD